MTFHPTDIVLSGTGLLSPLGDSLDTTWSAILAGHSALKPFKDMEQAEQASQLGLQGSEVNTLHGTPIHLRAETGLRKAIEQAWEEASLDLSKPPYEPSRISTVLGTSLHGMNSAGAYLRTNDLGMLQHFTSGSVVNRALEGFPVGGLRSTCCSACSSGLGSVAHAIALLCSDQADMVICGGYDPICEYAVGGFNALRVVAPDTVRPFSQKRQGMQVGEGYAILILERADAVSARGGRVRSLIAGLGESADAHHLTQPRQDGAGAKQAMQDALAMAQSDPKDIGLVMAHATGTQDNDAAEAQAIAQTFGDYAVPVTGMKSRLGHTLGAAGASEALIALKSLETGILPATYAVAADEVGEPVNLVTDEHRESGDTLNAVLSSSLGFGGANTAMVQRAPSNATPPRQEHVLYDTGITAIGCALPGYVGSGIPSLPDAPLSGSVATEQLAEWINARRTRRMSTQVKLSLAATAAALQHAGIASDKWQEFGAGTPALLGSTHGATQYCHDYYSQLVNDGLGTANPLLFAEGVPNAAAAHVSMTCKLTGPCQAIIGTVTSGIEALLLAKARIACGWWDKALVCVGEEHHEIIHHAWQHAGHLSPNIAPFEGAVCLLLERADTTERRILARLDGGNGQANIPSRSTHNFTPTNSAEFSMGPILQMIRNLNTPQPQRLACDDPQGQSAWIDFTPMTQG